jgi:hypothetical protein
VCQGISFLFLLVCEFESGFEDIISQYYTELAVLYSRLHVVGASKKLLLAVKIMCFSEVIFITIPTAVIGFGVRTVADKVPNFAPAASIIFKIECCAWSFCNTSIAALYFILLLKNWRRDAHKPQVRSLFIHLLCTTLLIALVDSVWIVISFSNLFSTIEPFMVRYLLQHARIGSVLIVCSL